MIELKNITAGYGRNVVLDGVTVGFEKGRLTGVIGVNGSGKSTLLKAILGMVPVTAGEVTIDGRSLPSMGRNATAKKVSYLSQGKNTPDMTVEQMVLHGRFPYLTYPRRYSHKDYELARAAMDRVGILPLAHRQLSSLSGGMRQAAYIAMALTQDTDYVLLDEPTTYLDISHQLELMRILRSLTDMGKGVVTVMHDLPMAFDFSDEIALLHGGELTLKDRTKWIHDLSDIDEVFGVKLRYHEEERKLFYSY